MLERFRKIVFINLSPSLWLLIITFICVVIAMILPIKHYDEFGFNINTPKNLGVITFKTMQNYPSTTDLTYSKNEVQSQYPVGQPLRLNNIGDMTLVQRTYQLVNRYGFRQLSWHLEMHNTSDQIQIFNRNQFMTKLNGANYSLQIGNTFSHEFTISPNGYKSITLNSVVPILGMEAQLVLKHSIYTSKPVLFN